MSSNKLQYSFPSHSQQQIFVPLLSRPVSNPFLCPQPTMSIPEYSLIQSFQALQKLQENQIKMNASYDLTCSEPTKRVRLTQQEYTNTNRGLVIPTPKKQTIQNEDLIQASQTLELIKRKQIEEQINQQMIQQYRIRQQLLQQLGYQQSDYVFQQHMMKIAQETLPKQLTTVQNQDKLLLSEVKETKKIELPQSPFEPKIMEQEWSDTFVKTKVAESPIKLEDLERTSGTSGVHSEDEIVQINSLEKQQQSKSKGKEKATNAKKTPVKAKQTKPKKVEYVDYYQTPIKEKSETRRKNKWQLQAEQQLEGSAADGQGANVNTQAAKAQQEEANVDYEYFQSITITNDPAKIGEEKAAKGFVVITRDTPVIKTETGPKETSVGSRYQAVISEVNQKTTRRRNPQQSWNPDMIYREKVTEYCENLKKILKCDHINEERALKLLTRKNYQSEKVEVNISKNEKFYSGFLVVHDLNKAADVVESISQEGQQQEM